MKDVAVAYGVSTRTMYRYLAECGDLWDVAFGSWGATFLVAPGSPPRRVSRWRQTP